jgi:hypothetical protein
MAVGVEAVPATRSNYERVFRSNPPSIIHFSERIGIVAVHARWDLSLPGVFHSHPIAELFLTAADAPVTINCEL